MSDAPRQVEGETALTRRGVRVELASAASFVVAMLASIGLAVVYWQGGQPQAEGVLLALRMRYGGRCVMAVVLRHVGPFRGAAVAYQR